MASWFAESYSRLLVDNHVSEDNPGLMADFDPTAYVRTIVSTGCDAHMVPAVCINGNCYYPAGVGHMHENLRGRDTFGRTVTLLRESGVAPVAYYNVIWHRRAAVDNPTWRFRDADGNSRSGRYWLCCPNNPEYRGFSEAQIREVVSYDVAGLFIDMAFWPGICYCPVCRVRFRKECGAEIPTRIDWDDRTWVCLQRARERWLNDFCALLRQAATEQKPDLSVVFQFSPVMLGWYLGMDSAFSLASDYASGDFYGGKVQQRLGTKVMSAFSTNVPFEFMTSRCVNMVDHTSTKSQEELVCSAATTLTNGGAYLFIDAINPDGTLDAPAHAHLAAVNASLRPLVDQIKAARPVLVSDVGLYFSMESCHEPDLNGTEITDFLGRTSISNMESVTQVRALEEVLGTSVVLGQSHQPYRVVRNSTTDLSSLRTIIANSASVMSEAEADRLREFVRNGGTLFATGETSLHAPNGSRRSDFLLADVLGVSFTGRKAGRISYLSSREHGYVVCDYPAPLVRATTASVLARVAEPFTDPDDPDHHASIHSNPPGPVGEHVALSVNRWGEGTCVYVYSTLMALRQYAQQQFAAALFRRYLQSDFQVSANAPACVEVTVLRSGVGDRLLVCLTNYQDELPNIPIHDLTAAVRLPGTLAVSRRLDRGEHAEVGIEPGGRGVDVRIPTLETWAVVELELAQAVSSSA